MAGTCSMLLDLLLPKSENNIFNLFFKLSRTTLMHFFLDQSEWIEYINRNISDLIPNLLSQ